HGRDQPHPQHCERTQDRASPQHVVLPAGRLAGLGYSGGCAGGVKGGCAECKALLPRGAQGDFLHSATATVVPNTTRASVMIAKRAGSSPPSRCTTIQPPTARSEE